MTEQQQLEDIIISLLSVKKITKHSYSHHPYCRYVCIPSTTRCTSLSSLLFILIFIKSHILFFAHPICFAHLTVLLFCTFLYSIAHFPSYFFFLPIYIYIYIYSCVVLLLYNLILTLFFIFYIYIFFFFILCTVH